MMKRLKYMMLTATVVGLCCTGSVQAKNVMVPKMYVFGIAASFNDTIVHVTDIQTVDSAWIDSKTKFLLGRESYSIQMRDYLTGTLNMPYRTCITFFATKRSKIEKQYLKMMRLYGQDNKKKSKKKGQVRGFDVRHINQNQFHYKGVDFGQFEEPVAKAVKKKAKKEKKPSRKQLRKQRGR